MTDGMIDWAKVAELRDDIGTEDMGEVVTLFLTDAEDTLAQILGGEALEARLHYLKGSALTMGFSRLAEICRIGEAAAARNGDCAVDVAAVDRIFSASRQAFLEQLPQRIPGVTLPSPG